MEMEKDFFSVTNVELTELRNYNYYAELSTLQKLKILNVKNISDERMLEILDYNGARAKLEILIEAERIERVLPIVSGYKKERQQLEKRVQLLSDKKFHTIVEHTAKKRNLKEILQIREEIFKLEDLIKMASDPIDYIHIACESDKIWIQATPISEFYILKIPEFIYTRIALYRKFGFEDFKIKFVQTRRNMVKPKKILCVAILADYNFNVGEWEND
jgi:hypothetical protein